MRFSFARMGGIVAAPGLQVRASVRADDTGGEVTSEPDYRRIIDAAEGSALARDARQVAQASVIESRTTARDAVRYAFTIETSTGEDADVRASDADADTATPELARLVEWARREADAIVRGRIRS
jgi:hypothetical protein